MALRAQFRHTNLIARDMDRLVAFYKNVFGFAEAGPERARSGEWLDRHTGLKDVELRVLHLRLPDAPPHATELEIISYRSLAPAVQPELNRPGFAHVCFGVDDVKAAYDAVMAAGGSPQGEIIKKTTPAGGMATAVYVRDPEGNIIELSDKH
jgi:catechol 2,3-dioxygenase-like lactoylglutathione lyase family enzyme